MRMTLIIFQKKISLGQEFKKYFLKKLSRVKGANRYRKILIVFFQEKNSFGGIWSFWPLGHFSLFDWAWPNWARPLLIGSLNSQDMTRILKQWRHDFSGKHLRDILYGYYLMFVWRSKFMVLWSFFKNLLCKFVWM